MLLCQDLQSFKSLCGKDTKAVNVQADGCYNNALYSGVGKTPFQPSTQAIYVVPEIETNKKQIINVQTKSKLCSKRKRSSDIKCQHGVTSVEPKHLLVMRHVSYNHRKYIKNMSELTIHMPAKFKYEKQKMQDKFSMDLAERCQAEFTQAFNKFHNDTLKYLEIQSSFIIHM